MENVTTDSQAITDRMDALARLYELRDRIERHIAERGVSNPRSEAERHLQEHGHKLAYGCCR